MKLLKKMTACVLALAMLVTMDQVSIQAAVKVQTSTVKGLQSGVFDYKILSDGTAELEKYRGTAKDAVIPDTLEGKTVTKIGNGAFSSCDKLESVTIPAKVTEIGNAAFQQCGNLSSVEFAKDSKLKTIGNSAFYKDRKIKIHRILPGKTTVR